MINHEIETTLDFIEKEPSLKKVFESIENDVFKISPQANDLINEKRINYGDGAHLLMMAEGVQDLIKHLIEKRKIK